jgi:photosystem II stability/assembly factor-like uncharacterized protein
MNQRRLYIVLGFKTLSLFFILIAIEGYSQNWTNISVTGNIQKIAFNNQIGVAVGDNGLILRTTNGGESYYPVNSGVNDNLVDVKYIGNNVFIACGWIWGNHGVVLKSIDNGNTWNTVISLNGSYNEIFGIYKLNNDTIFISGTNKLIKTYDGFNSFTTSSFENGYQYRSLFFNNSLISMAHAGSVVMRKSYDFGVSYINCNQQPASNMLRDMTFSNNLLFAIGDNGSFCFSADGDNWNMLPTENLNFKSINELGGELYTCTTSDVFLLQPNGNINSIFSSNNINSTGVSSEKIFALGNNFIAFSSVLGGSSGGGNGGTAGNPAASVPAEVPYQAVIRDNAGTALVNAPLTVRFTLHQNTTDGTIEYQETQSLTTNSLGLINTQFGSGAAAQGTFANINWSNTTKFIQLEVNTGNGFVDIGTQQLMSVPFAFQANKATAIKNAGLPVYADNAAALAGGLAAGDMYRTAAGILMIVY